MNNKLMLDIDDVIYPFSDALYTELQVYSGLTEDYDTFWRRSYARALYWENLVRNEPLYARFPPTRQMMRLLNLLSSKYEIYYITSRPEELTFVTKYFFKKYDLPQKENLIFTGHRKKSTICNSLEITLAVEDMVHNIKDLALSGIQTLFPVKPWNDMLLNNPITNSMPVVNVYELESVLC